MKSPTRNLTISKLFLLIFLLVLSPVLSAPPVLAQVNIPATFPTANFTSVGHLVSVLLSNAYVIGGILFLFMLIIAGLTYVFGAGNKDPHKIQAAHQSLMWSLIGISVIIASYWIIQVLEVLTGFKILGR